MDAHKSSNAGRSNNGSVDTYHHSTDAHAEVMDAHDFGLGLNKIW